MDNKLFCVLLSKNPDYYIGSIGYHNIHVMPEVLVKKEILKGTVCTLKTQEQSRFYAYSMIIKHYFEMDEDIVEILVHEIEKSDKYFEKYKRHFLKDM